MIHTLKTDPGVFRMPWNGTKLYEIRLDDRDFKVNDISILAETVYSGKEMEQGRPLRFTNLCVYQKVLHKLTGQYGLRPGWCILSVEFLFREICCRF